MAADSADLLFQISLAIVLPRLTEKGGLIATIMTSYDKKRPTCSFEDMNGAFNIA